MGTALDLDLWGHVLRVRAQVPDDVAGTLQAALADHLVDEPAPLGFVVKPPDKENGLHCLIDRSGLVLARARGWDDCIAVLAEHLATFAPAPASTIRTSMRAVIRGEGATQNAALAAFPLLNMPALVERQLQRRDQRVVDRLAIDMTPDGRISLAALPWPELRPGDPVGHVGADASGVPVDAVLLPAALGVSLRRHQLVALIGSTISGLGPDAALDLAERFVDRASTVPMNDEAARRRALER